MSKSKDMRPPKRGDVVRPKRGGDKAEVTERFVVATGLDDPIVTVKLRPLRKSSRWFAAPTFFLTTDLVVVKRAKGKK
jgi:hypothetical protein